MNLKIAGLLAVAIGTAASPAAFAADIPAPVYKEPPARVVAYNWSGLYLGIHGGYAFDAKNPENTSISEVGTDGFATLNSTYEPMKAAFGGVQLGYNYQLGTLILGWEVDASFGNFKNTSQDIVNVTINDDPPVGFNLGTTGKYSFDWLVTTRAKFGYAYDRWMFYGTGGAAFAKPTILANSFFNEPTAATAINVVASNTKFVVGWTAGGGVEVAFTDHISFKTEYLYVSLPSVSIDIPPSILNPITVSGKANFHTVRAGLNFRWPPP